MSTVATDYEIMQEVEKMTDAVALFNLEATIEQLRAANPWAIASSPKMAEVTRASRNLRKQLSVLFPGTKFSVTSKSYSGGDSIRVKWMDGPAFKEVTPIVDAYERGSFDGMQDLYEYDRSAAGKAHSTVFGSTKYAFCERSLSADVLNTANDWIESTYGKRFTVEVSDIGTAWFSDLTSYHETAHIYHRVNELLAATSF